MKFVFKSDMLPETGLVLACVSGGADSMCLLGILLEESRTRGFTVAAAHYNHMLRGAEADRDEMFVRDYCGSRGIDAHCGRGDVKAYAKVHKLCVEEAAREMRYAFFHSTAAELGAVKIATAHTADDNAETVLLNLTRGAGTHGLAGIVPERGIIIRPMLGMTRGEVMAYLTENGIPYNEDSSNSLDIYTRNRIRHNVIPELKTVNPRFLDAITSLTAVVREDDDYLRETAERFVEEHCTDGKAPVSGLNALHRAVAGRAVRKLAGENAGLSHAHVKAVLDLCASVKPSGSVSLPGTTVYREYDCLLFRAGTPVIRPGFEPIYPENGDIVKISGPELEMSCKMVVCSGKIYEPLTKFLFKSDEICGRIVVRPRCEGDKIKLGGCDCTKTLQKLYIERHIPVRKRQLIPVIADETGVLAIYGVGRSGRAVAKPGDMAFELNFEGGSGL